MPYRQFGLRLRALNPVMVGLLLLGLMCSAQEVPAPRVIDLTAPDGTNLKGTYFAAGKPGPGILLMHQCNRQRKIWDGLAASLAGVGFNVLTFDFRGFGESSGTAAFTLPPLESAKMLAETWPGDVDTAFRYLQSQPGVSRDLIGAGGASCGVNQAIQLARRHSEVRALMLLSGFTDRDGRQFLHQFKAPVFFAAADDDAGAVEPMQWLYDLTPNPGNTFQHYQTGGHGIEMFAPHKELPGMIVAWFGNVLSKTPGVTKSATAPRSSSGMDMLELIDGGGAATAAQKLAAARQRDPKAVLFSEALVNLIGYEHLAQGDNKGAIEVLKLNVTAYPRSPNVYDSLSDAYLADGQNDLARTNAKKVLELLPSDTTDPEDRRNAIKASAEQKLNQLGDTPH